MMGLPEMLIKSYEVMCTYPNKGKYMFLLINGVFQNYRCIDKCHSFHRYFQQ